MVRNYPLTNSTKTRQKRMRGSLCASHAAPGARGPQSMASVLSRSSDGSSTPDVTSVGNLLTTMQAGARVPALTTATPQEKSEGCSVIIATSSWDLQKITCTSCLLAKIIWSNTHRIDFF